MCEGHKASSRPARAARARRYKLAGLYIVDICSYAQVAGVDVQDRRGEGKALDGGNRHAFVEVPGWR